MKQVICDECGVHANPNEYGGAPKGWLTVNVSGVYTPSKDYCSLSCAVIALNPGSKSASELSPVDDTIVEGNRLSLEPASLA